MSGSEPRSWTDLSDDELLALSDADFDAVTADVAGMLDEGSLDIELEQPSETLWQAIAAEAGIGRPELSLVDEAPIGSLLDDERDLGAEQPLERRSDAAPTGAAFKAASRWSGRTAALTLVAAAVLLVLVPLGLSQRSGDDEPEVLAQADLEVLDPSASAGHADLVADDDRTALALDFEASAPSDEYLELWLLAVDDDGDIETLSLGRVDGDGTYEIPADVDRSRFNIVDISIEADDGDAAHSGRSILRGQLTT